MKSIYKLMAGAAILVSVHTAAMVAVCMETRMAAPAISLTNDLIMSSRVTADGP